MPDNSVPSILPPQPETANTDLGQKMQKYQQDRFAQQQDNVDKKSTIKPILLNDNPSRTFIDNINNADLPTDPFQAGRSFAYGADIKTGNFERYYTHPNYSKLGYSPFRDNEKVYNDASTGWQDFRRMSHQWAGLANTGFKDMWEEIFDPASLSADIKNSDDMERKMSIGSSSKPGLAGGITNFALNTAYTAGIMGEMLAEEGVLAGATLLTGGADAEATVPGMVASASKAGRLISKGAGAILDIKDFNEASKLYEASRMTSAAGKLAKGAVDFINPLDHLTELYKDTKLPGATWETLTNFAKVKKTAGAVWRDAREIRAVTSESRLEGGSTYTKVKEDLLKQFYDSNNRAPDEKEGKDMDERAQMASRADILGNIPLIYASNKIVLETALKGILPMEKSTAAAIADEAGRVVRKEGAILGEDMYERAGTYSLKGAKDALHPISIAKHGLKYVSANLAEGIQETGQDALSAAAADYYEQPILDPSIQGHKGYLASISKGLATQMTGQGLETFASGFFMGGALQGPQHLVFNTIPRAFNKIVSPQKFEEYEKQKNDYLDSVVNSMNEVSKNPLMSIRAIDHNFIAQNHGKAYAEKAMENDDIKSAKDAQQEAIFHHVYNLLRTGKQDILKDHIKALQQMDDKNLADAMDMSSSTEEDKKNLRQSLDSFGKKVDEVRDKYDYYNKNIVNNFKSDTEEYKALEFAKMTATFSRFDFDNTLSRMASVADTLAKSKPIAAAAFTDYRLLFEKPVLNHEMQTLKDEIGILKDQTDSDSKKQLADKEKKHEALKVLKSDISAYEISLAAKSIKDSLPGETHEVPSDGIEDVIKYHTNQLYDSYARYLNVLADNHGENLLTHTIHESFKGLKDYYALKHDSKIAATAVNLLADPKFMSGFPERTANIMRERKGKEQENRKQALSEFLSRKENNDLMNALYDAGAYIAPTDIDALTDKDKTPHEFYDVDTHDLVKPDSKKMKKIIDLVEEYERIKQNRAPGEEIPETTESIYNTQSRKRYKGDKRKFEDYAKEYGFDITRPGKVPTQKVLSTIIDSKHASIREKALARRLLSLTGSNEMITFSKKSPIPGSYTSNEGVVIDPRYSSSNYKGGVTPIERVILSQLITKLTNEGLTQDVEFNNAITSLRERAENYSKTPKATSALGVRPLYGLKDNTEFIAEAMTNDTFQVLLRNIPSEVEGASSWTEFLDSIRAFFQRLFKTDPRNTVLDEAINVITTKIDRAFPTRVPGTTESIATATPERSIITPLTPVTQLPQELKSALISIFKRWNESAPADISMDLEGLSDYDIGFLDVFKNFYMSANPLKNQMIEEYNSVIGKEIPKTVPEDMSQQEILDLLEGTEEKTTTPLGAGKVEPVFISGTPIVEHGEDSATKEEKENGIEPTNLTKSGREEAEQIGEYAKQTNKTAIEASPVERAQQTAKIAAEVAEVPVKTNPNLATWNIGEFDGRPEGSFKESEWIHSNDTPKGGESFSEFTTRMERAYIDADKQDNTTLMIAHSKVLRALNALKKTGGKWTPETTRLFLNEKEGSGRTIHESYKGKIVYATPGTGKTTLAKTGANIIDADDIIVDEMRSIPQYKLLSREQLLKTERGTILNNKIKTRLKKLASEGNTVLTGTTKFMDIADKIFISKNDDILMQNRFKDQTALKTFKARETRDLKKAKVEPENFTGYIEDELAKPFGPEETKSIISETVPERSLEDKFATITDITDLQDLTIQLVNELNDPMNILENKLQFDVIDKLVNKKLEELRRNINFEDVNVGNILVMRNKSHFGNDGRAVVVKKTDTRLEVMPLDGRNTVHYVPKDKMEDYVEFQSNKLIPTDLPELSPEQEALIEESLKNVQDNSNNPDNKTAVEEAKADPKSNEDAADDLFNETNC